MIRSGFVALGALLLLAGPVRAQSSSLDALEEDLKEAKQLHQDTSAQAMATFFQQVDAAMGSPDTAIQLYQEAGGILPDPTPVTTEHETESASEKEARLAQDRANQLALGVVLQLHCGVMHFAALYVTKPDQKGLDDDWAAWLQKAAQAYPQLNLPPPNIPDPKPEQNPDGGHKKKKDHDNAQGKPFNPSDLMAKAVKDSIISKYLGFKQWADKEQGAWAVKDIPKLYRTNVLEPLRAKPTTATLAAWDVYIAMANVDEKDPDKWAQVDYPPLQFDRACDDCAVAPGTEKLEALVNMIKANPTFPQVDDWIARTKALMDAYRSSRGGRSTVAQNPGEPGAFTPPTNSNVNVTTEQQGDATIITTHTNTPPVNPPAPQ